MRPIPILVDIHSLICSRLASLFPAFHACHSDYYSHGVSEACFSQNPHPTPSLTTQLLSKTWVSTVYLQQWKILSLINKRVLLLWSSYTRTHDTGIFPSSWLAEWNEKYATALISQLMIYFTGRALDDIILPSRNLREVASTVIAIGVGDALRSQLRAIASAPVNSNTFAIDDFDELDNFISRLATTVCFGTQNNAL